jgi:hypothetical protein
MINSPEIMLRAVFWNTVLRLAVRWCHLTRSAHERADRWCFDIVKKIEGAHFAGEDKL